MMATSFSMILFLFTLIGGGGGNHLLDYASTEAFWKSKGVIVNVQTMTAELKSSDAQDISELIKQLASPDGQVRAGASKKIVQLGEAVLPQLEKAADIPDPEVAASVKTLIADISAASKKNAVRRLMAIRALGELKKPDAVATLRPLLNAKEMFVAEYAARSIAQLEGKPIAPGGATAEQKKSDLALLTADCRLVVQVAPAFAPVPVDVLIEKIPAAAIGNPNKDQIKADLTKAVLLVAEMIGDVRVDSVTLGSSADFGPNAGFAAIIIRGQYDSAAVRQALMKLQIAPRPVGGTDVFSPDEHFSALFPANDRAIGITGANPQVMNVEGFATALKTGKGGLESSDEMKKLLATVDTTQPLWAVLKMTDTLKQVPIFSAFEQIMLVGKVKDQTVDIQINGQGQNAAQVAAAVDQLNAAVQQGINQLKPMAQDAPFMSQIVKTLEGIQCKSEGEKATLTLSVKADTATLIGPMLFGVRSTPELAPPPAAQVIPPPPPQPQLVK
ncbi:MAG TPA: HEAT repeat domain-containing protein [Tepidisphaeraceae bacterium]|nr:HEAT repeat domain-containing protein [Tepidisphaeraceae bacterium]